ncbi:retrovirus-related Pol polyprotein from transposon 17.6 [Trichonephila clavipes]|nr:retrovirus-related Pol polyprotein from transposon 17.6 [Trichonephila clavipes]
MKLYTQKVSNDKNLIIRINLPIDNMEDGIGENDQSQHPDTITNTRYKRCIENYKISCILKQQKPNGNQHSIAFHSRRLRNYEINYTITELECLAIIDSLDKFHCYLHGSHFTVHTDHNALVWLKNFKNPTARLFRWSLKVSMYDFDIKYKKGSTNVEADMLTRNPIAYHIINTPPEPLLDINEISHFQNIENTSAPKCFKRDGVFEVKRQGLTKIIVPKALRVKLMETTHKNLATLV